MGKKTDSKQFASRLRTLPDLLRPGLDIVFVGINPGESSARLRHYYGHPSNGFWSALSASALVKEHSQPLQPKDDYRLLDCCGIGFTDIVKRVVTDSMNVRTSEIRASAAAFRQRIIYSSPRIICFTTTRAFDVLHPGVRLAQQWGRQPITIEGSSTWVMPSTSGKAASYRPHVHQVLNELAFTLGRADP